MVGISHSPSGILATRRWTGTLRIRKKVNYLLLVHSISKIIHLIQMCVPTLEFGCPLEPTEKLRLEPSRIIYGNVLQHSLGANPITPGGSNPYSCLWDDWIAPHKVRARFHN